MSPHLKRSVYCQSGPIQIVQIKPFGRGENWVAWECVNIETGETRHSSEHTCLLTFNDMILQLNQTDD